MTRNQEIAEKAAQRIREYWFKRGYNVIVKVGVEAGGDRVGTIYSISSNLKNGVPPRGSKIKAKAA